MKIKDYIRIANLNIIGHKNQTRNIITGFSFSLTFLVLTIFIFSGLFFGINQKFNEVRILSSYKLQFSSLPTEIALHQQCFDSVKEIEGIEDIIVRETIGSSIAYQAGIGLGSIVFTEPKLIIDGQEFFLDYQLEVNDPKRYDYFEFYDLNLSSNMVSRAEIEYLENLGYGKAIEGRELTNINEVLISSSILSLLNLTVEDVINKTICYQTCLNASKDTYDDEGNEYGANLIGEYVNLFDSYVIVGVFNDKLYDIQSRGYDRPIFWLNAESLSDEYGNRMGPIIEQELAERNGSPYYKYKAVYEKSIFDYSQEAIEAGRIFFAVGFNGVNVGLNNTIIQFESFDKAKNALIVLDSYYLSSYDNVSVDMLPTFRLNISNDIILNYIKFFPIFMFISYMLLFVGCIVLTVTLLNLYNYTNYSINNRKRYLGVLKALGLQPKKIVKIYFYETIMIFAKALIVSVLISFIFSLVTSLAIGSELDDYSYALPVTINLDIKYYFLSILSFGLLIFGFSLLFSYFLCRNVSKTKIIDLLKM